MASRRAVLKGSLAAAAAAAVWRNGLAQTPRRREHGPDHLVLDRGSPLSPMFEDHARAAAIPTFATEGDITALWFEVLDPLWRQEHSTVAGITSPEAIFCLERLAWDHGMRMVFRADEVANASGTELRLRARPAALDHALTKLRANPRRQLAQAACLLHCPIAEGPLTAHTLCADVPAASAHWVSWVMAPRARL
jgi:hypothetical protein